MSKRPDLILVDVHNCLHRDNACRQLLHRQGTEAARAHLAEQLCRDRGRTVLVCDGGPHHGLVVRDELSFLYSGHRSADDVIIAQLRQAKGRVQVVTDDRELRGRARAHGAQLEHCQAWWQRQRASGNHHATETDRGPPPPEDVAMWMDIFSGDQD